MLDHDWRHDAACTKPDVDPDWFFPGDTAAATTANYKLARAVCNECPVIGECRKDSATFIQIPTIGSDGARKSRPVGVFAAENEDERSGEAARKRKYNMPPEVKARRAAQARAKRRNETPEQREARLVKHREQNRNWYENKKKKVA